MVTPKIHLQPKFKYIPSFDSLRGFAVFMVLLLHGSYGFFKGGWIGVDLFFALSGYLITSILLTEYFVSGKLNIGQFYIRRGLRLFPGLMVCVLIANFLWPFTEFFSGANQKEATIAALFYFTNFIPGSNSGNMAHLWSLSVEEHFYLFWPFIMLLVLLKISFRNKIALLLILIILVSIFRIYTYNNVIQFAKNTVTIDSFKFTLCRIDTIFIGSLLAIILAQTKNTIKEYCNKTATIIILVIIILFVIILFSVSEDNIYFRKGGFLLTNLLCVFTLIIALKNPHHYFFSNKIFQWAGKRSYGIYIYHFPVFLVLENLRQNHSFFNFLYITFLRILFTLIITEISYLYIEQPFLKLKRVVSSKL